MRSPCRPAGPPGRHDPHDDVRRRQPVTNLVDNLNRTAEQHGDRPAIKLDDLVLTYSELQDGARRVAALLRSKGVGCGDRVGLVLPNVPSFPVLFYGAVAIGAVVVPMNPLLKGREVRFYLEDSGAAIVFAWKDMAAGSGQRRLSWPGSSASRSVSTSPRCSASTTPTSRSWTATTTTRWCLLYTSGTTGQPKGAQLTHHSMGTNASTSAETLVELTEEDVVMGCLPLFHVFGLTVGLNAASAQGVVSDPDPALQPREGARDRGSRPRHRLRGRPDDVLRAAAREEPPIRPTCPAFAPVSPAGRRCRSR